MVRVLLNNGRMDTAYIMGGICEEIVEIEGKKKRVYKEAKDIGSANGIKFEMDECEYFIGNISNDKVKAVLRNAVEKGYLNCVDLALEAVEDVNGIEDGVPYIEMPAGCQSEDMGAFSCGSGVFGAFSQPIGAFSQPTGVFGQPAGGFGEPMGAFAPQTDIFGQPMGAFGSRF